MADEKVSIQLVLEKKDADRVLNQLPKDVGRSGAKSGDRFSSGFKRGLTSLSRQVFNLRNAFLSLGSAVGAAFALREVIQAANTQEDAINRLNSALKQNGEFTQETSNQLQQFASQLQSTTRFGDEALLNQLALAQSFGATADQSREVVTAWVDLASALGIDLQSATRNVSKTLGGYAGELGEVIPELKELSQEQLRAGEGIDIIAEKFQGFAQRDVKTFSGALQQAQNSFGDLQEEIGFLITRSPVVTDLLNQLTQQFITLSGDVSNFAKQGGFQTLLLNAVEFGKGLNDFVIAPIEILVNTSNTLFQGLLTGVSGAVATIGQAAGAIGRAFDSIGISPETAESLQNFSESSLGVFNDRLKTTEEAIANTFSTEKSEQVNAFLDNFKSKIIEFNDEVGHAPGTAITEDQQQVLEESQSRSLGLWDSFLTGLTDKQKEFDKNTKKNFEGLSGRAVVLGQAIKKGIGQGVASGFASFGAALVEGDNALDAFAKSFLSTLGQLMIQQGAAFILQGLGFSVIPGLGGSGASLIATGAALSVFGGALSAVGGGGSSPAAASAGNAASGVGGGAIGSDTNIATQVDREQLQERQTQNSVNVNVQGDVLDSDETGLRIVELINQGLERDGAIVVREA